MGEDSGKPVTADDGFACMAFMGNSITCVTITAASAAAVVWASQLMRSHVLPAFETVTAVLAWIG
ncbi:hypothetical protein AAIH25_15070 [Arthrobacter crystallopoietes]|uniref:hypothetical protein n=1 Tax=Crystallibacter crystallopoietes TaxID=37928 RepID=UPI003D2481ED